MKYQLKCPCCGEKIEIANLEIRLSDRLEEVYEDLDEIDSQIGAVLVEIYGIYGQGKKQIYFHDILGCLLDEHGVELKARSLGHKLRKLGVTTKRKRDGTVALINRQNIENIRKKLG